MIPRRLLFRVFVLALSLALPAAGYAQITLRASEEPEPEPEGFPYVDRLPGPGGGLEQAVDGSTYRLGPGDVLVLTVLGPKPMTYDLPVTVEGMLLIPEVGVVDVDGVLLNEAKEEVRRRVMRQYHGVEVHLSLTLLRRFQIHVLGQVNSPGTYLGTPVDRVSGAVSWAGGVLPTAGQRRIQIQNQGKVRATADLFAFFQRGDPRYNPVLQDGDVILVPYAMERVRALGAVSDPGPQEFLLGDRFSDLLTLAGGFTSEVAADTVEVARYPKGQSDPQRFFLLNGGGIVPAPGHTLPELRTFETFRPETVWLPELERPAYTDFELQPNDIVFVRTAPSARVQRLVEVTGEVRFPGQYPVLEGETRLSDVIAWAGGLTEDASLVEAQLIRRGAAVLTDRELERLRTMPVADMREDEYNYFKMKSRTNPGSMVVDFARALAEPGSEADLHLEQEDLIIIPRRKEFVSVLGMVASPGNVRYRPGLDAKEYIELAGGFAANAKKGSARVIRAERGEWVPVNKAGELNPGDTVMVPEKPERDWWRIFRDFLLVTTQILAIYIVIDNATQ